MYFYWMRRLFSYSYILKCPLLIWRQQENTKKREILPIEIFVPFLATHPLPRIWARIRGRCWSAKIDDISL
jgi:hypothetical protein